MTKLCARIDSYFSLETDLATEMRSWPEFVRGETYSVELVSAQERVTLSLVAATGDDAQHVVVEGEGTRPGMLFERALGAAAFAMAAHSDSVSVHRWDADA